MLSPISQTHLSGKAGRLLFHPARSVPFLPVGQLRYLAHRTNTTWNCRNHYDYHFICSTSTNHQRVYSVRNSHCCDTLPTTRPLDLSTYQMVSSFLPPLLPPPANAFLRWNPDRYFEPRDLDPLEVDHLAGPPLIPKNGIAFPILLAVSTMANDPVIRRTALLTLRPPSIGPTLKMVLGVLPYPQTGTDLQPRFPVDFGLG